MLSKLAILLFLATASLATPDVSDAHRHRVWESLAKAQLHPFSSGISKADLDPLSNSFLGFDVIIYNNMVYVANYNCTGGAHAALLHLLKVACSHGLPNMRLFLSTNEGYRRRVPTPIFLWNKRPQDALLHYPYWSLLWGRDAADIFNHVPWDKREPRAHWRGSTTGGGMTLDTFNESVRVTVARTCNARPDLCEAGITNVVQVGPGVAEAIQDSIGILPPLPMSNWTKFKYQIVLDGNVSPSSRMATLMQSGSVLLKQNSWHTEFFYHLMVPWVHYVPIADNLSDLEEKIEWLQKNDKFAADISQAGMRFHRNFLTSQHVRQYYATLLTKYADKLNFVVEPSDEYRKLCMNVHVWNVVKPDTGNVQCPPPDLVE